MTSIVILGILEAAVCIVLMYLVIYKRKAAMRKALESLKTELKEKTELKQQFLDSYAQMVSVIDIADALKEVAILQESVKAERGRITITQTELETVETRLCEVEEIERELEASNLETKEELEILKKKEAELKTKNDALKKQIVGSVQELDKVLSEIEMTAQMLEHIATMKNELVVTESKIESLVVQIEEMNAHYVSLKMRYDALDIEYAQLYEKFSANEAMMQQKEES